MSDLTSSIEIKINIFVDLIKQIKCKYCKFSDSSKMNCTRTAKYQDNNNKIRCSMYLYKGI